jgi:hypothetical protein
LITIQKRNNVKLIGSQRGREVRKRGVGMGETNIWVMPMSGQAAHPTVGGGEQGLGEPDRQFIV